MHTVTDSFHGYWVYPSSPPSGFVPLLGYSYSPFTRLAPYSLGRPSDCHCRAPQLHSVIVLHCLGGGCQCLGFSSNVYNASRSIVTVFCNVTRFIVTPAPPLFFFHFWYLGFRLSGLSIIYFVGVYGKGFTVDSSPCTYLMFLIPPL